MVGPPPNSWGVQPDRARAFELAPGVWQLRLPLPWPLIPHVNAYLIESSDGPMLVDCGSAGHPSHRVALAAALETAGTTVTDVRTLVATHAHSDHVGLAQWVIEQSGCEFLMHPDTGHFYDAMREPERIDAARRRRAWQEGVPDADLPDYGDVREETEGVLAPIEPDRPLHDGDRIGSWEVLETPGHAPSHISLVDRSRGVLILGDLLAPVFGPWYDYGYSPDPVGEFLRSLDRVAALGPLELALPGHGRALDHVPSIIEDHRGGVADRLEATLAALRLGPDGAYAITVRVFGELPPLTMVWRMTEIACYLRHLRLAGIVTREEDADGRFRYVARSDIPIAR
jgi:glyoxylase-like metal-dependent hydrolase (beta-lactamase superfamily II)